MNPFNNLTQAYKSIRHRNKIANINLSDLVHSNFESACAVYRGFFGEPMVDSDLLTAYKNIRNDSPLDKKIKDCHNVIYRFGFDIFTSKSNEGTSMKIMMIPRSDIRAYMLERSLGKEYSEIVNLYKSLGGNVI